MPKDPALAADTCIFMEAVSGDGGVHTGGAWWLSPDIALTGVISGPDKADPGQDNTVAVTCHRKPVGTACDSPPGAESVSIELWVGVPSLAMAPNNPASTKMVDSIGTPVLAAGATHTQTFIFNPPTGLDPTDPRSPGHKCLIARCYPDLLIPSDENFFAPEDPHVAQHNICIVPCGGPGAARQPGPCGFEVATTNPDRKRAQWVRLRAVVDLNPDKFVREVVLDRLKHTHGFNRLATTPPQGFRFELPRFPDAQLTDNTKPGCLGSLFGGAGRRSYEAKIKLEAGQTTRFNFIGDLSRAKLGDAYIFHLRQIGEDNHDQGGLTIVMLAV